MLVRETRAGKFQQEIMSGPHRFLADEPVKLGGLDSGPGPYDFLLAASRRLHVDDDRGSMPTTRSCRSKSVSVRLSHDKIHAKDCENCETKDSMVDRIDRAITLEGPLDDDATPAADGDRRQMPGASDAGVGDRHHDLRAAGLTFLAAPHWV